MERVRTRLGGQIDHSASEAPILRPEIVRLNFEFLNGILRGDHSDDVQVCPIGGHAIQKDLALTGLAASDLKIAKSKRISADWASARIIASRGRTLRHYAGHQGY